MPTTGDLLATLAKLYPRERVTVEQMAAYGRFLADVPPAVLEQAVAQVVATAEFFPSIASLRSACAELQLGLPSELEALDQVDAVLAWRRLDEDTRGAVPALHDVVKSTLRTVGGTAAFVFAERPELVRAQFLKLYREARAAAIETAQVPPLGRRMALGAA